MSINLSKYPPGTKLKLNNGEIVFFVGKCYTKDHESDYVIEHDGWQGLGYRKQDGTHPLCEPPQYIKSVIQLDKYLVSYRDQSDTIRTIIVVDPKSLTIDSFYESVKSVTTGYRQPYDILSWSKIEE